MTEMKWDKMKWDKMNQDEMKWDEMNQDKMNWDEMKKDEPGKMNWELAWKCGTYPTLIFQIIRSIRIDHANMTLEAHAETADTVFSADTVNIFWEKFNAEVAIAQQSMVSSEHFNMCLCCVVHVILLRMHRLRALLIYTHVPYNVAEVSAVPV